MRILRSLLWIVAAGLLSAGHANAAGNPEAGKVKASTCMGCHGIVGYNNVYPTYHVPKLGGQSPEFLAAALKEYRGGDRSHKTMRAQAANLSDADIEDIAAFLSKAPAYKHATPAGGGQSVEKATACFACHGDKGVSQNPMYPNLAGQYQDYLQNALKSYKSGARKNPVMAGMAAGLSDADIKILAGYFAAQKGPLYTPKLEQ